jgi:hypothetical protein
MIDLASVLPAPVLAAANDTVLLQEALMRLTEPLVPATIETILSLPFKNSSEGVLTLTNNFLLTVQYRPYSLRLVASIIKTLVGLSSPDNHFSEIKYCLLKIPPRVVDEKWRLALVHETLFIGVFNEDEVYDGILKFMHKHPILPNRPFWKNNHRHHFIFFVWFAPLISRKDPALFESLWEMIKSSLARKELAPSFTSFCENFESLRANNWADYATRARGVYPSGCLAEILRSDDLAQFRAIAESATFAVDSRIETSIFEYASFLLRGPTLVQFCALSGSINCFNYLVSKGANLTLRDSGKRILLHFAIAGGHPDIIHKATEVIDDFVVATRVSAEFHRFELFRTFLTTKDVDLKANDIENGSIFHGIAAANHIRMILFCIEQGCNVNLKDADGWSPLNCAIDFCALEAVLVLTSHVDIDVNGQDEYGVRFALTYNSTSARNHERGNRRDSRTAKAPKTRY